MRNPLTNCRLLSRTPDSVKIRIYETYGFFYVLVRDGEGWESIGCFAKKDDALQVILDYYDRELRRWSLEVKIKDGRVCKDCGELDRRLLESDHIKPIYKYPELKYELSNGRCRCIRCHAKKHEEEGEPEIAAMILERLKQVA